ncbi:hypothetical protein MRX96_006303 [Rhipicephalus microplus]
MFPVGLSVEPSKKDKPGFRGINVCSRPVYLTSADLDELDMLSSVPVVSAGDSRLSETELLEDSEGFGGLLHGAASSRRLITSFNVITFLSRSFAGCCGCLTPVTVVMKRDGGNNAHKHSCNTQSLNTKNQDTK